MMRNTPPPLCGIDCKYRKLYEGTQSSLTDMASKQADALGRVGRLRGGIISTLKRTFGRQFSEAERQAGRRLSELDDEILLAYMGSFLALAAMPSEDEGSDDLRVALLEAGLTLPAGGDMSEWAQAVRAQTTRGLHRHAFGGGEGNNDLSELFADEAETSAAAPRSTAPAQRQAPESNEVVKVEDKVEGHTGASRRARRNRGKARPAEKEQLTLEAPGAMTVEDLEDLFRSEPEPTMPDEEPNFPDKDPYFEPDTNPYEADTHVNASEVDEVMEEDVWDIPDVSGDVATTDTQGDALDGQGDMGDADDSDDDIWETSPVHPGSGATAALGIDHDLSGLFEEEVESPVKRALRRAEAETTQALSAPKRTLRRPVKAAPVEVTQEEAPEAALSDMLVAPMRRKEETREDEPAPREELVSPVAVTPAPVVPSAEAERPRTQQLTAPLRPELFPAAAPSKGRARRGGGRVVRTSATPPDARIFDVPPEASMEDGTGLTDELRSKLLAAVCIPRPVFTSDLVAVAGSQELVAAWETERRAEDDAPVKFIPPKARHRARGALVLPSEGDLRTAATEFKRSAWGECMKRYRGAKLYELGVLLHRMGDELVGHRLGDSTVLLRLNQPRGLVGVVVVIDTALESGGTARSAMSADVEELLSERLTLVAVLTTNAETLEGVVVGIEEEARRRSWDPAMPVVAAKSWEYASDRGASSTLVIGS